MKKIDETIVTMTTENNHLGGMTMKNNLNTANDVLPEHAAEPEDFYNEEGLLCCGVCGKPKEQFLPENMPASVRRVKDRMAIPCACGQAVIDKNIAREEERKHAEMVKKLRERCFGSAAAVAKYPFDNANGMMSKLELVREYVAHWDEVFAKGWGLNLWGDVGTGKTHAAACAANALIEQGVSVIMLKLSDYIDSPQEERQALLKQMGNCKLLIIDDFGVEYNHEYVQKEIYKVIDHRYENGKPLIITTNLPLSVFDNPENDNEKRVFSRLQEMCPQRILFDGEDRRKIFAKENRAKMTKLLTGESA